MKSPIERKISKPLQDSLNFFLNSANDLNNLSSNDWMRFYNFIVIAYRSGQNSRPSVSQLSDILKSYGTIKPGNLSVLYAHALFVLAMNEGLSIYGDGFNP